MSDSTKEPPYLITVVFAILGWLLTTYVDRLQQIPLITYETEIAGEKKSIYWKYQQACGAQSGAESEQIYVFKLNNLSLANVFTDLTFHVKLTDASITSAKIHARPPAMAGKQSASCTATSATFPNISLLPGGQLDLAIGVDSTAAKPYMLVDPTDQAVRLAPYNYQAFLLEYEFYLLGLLVLGLLIVAGSYLFNLLIRK